MICETYTFDPAEGWSRPLRGELDSERTVAFVFGASRLGVEACAALDALRATLPRAVFVGCSTAGEIHGVRVLDDSLVVAVARFRAVSVEYAEAPRGSTSHPSARSSAANAFASASRNQPRYVMLPVTGKLQTFERKSSGSQALTTHTTAGRSTLT